MVSPKVTRFVSSNPVCCWESLFYVLPKFVKLPYKSFICCQVLRIKYLHISYSVYSRNIFRKCLKSFFFGLSIFLKDVFIENLELERVKDRERCFIHSFSGHNSWHWACPSQDRGTSSGSATQVHRCKYMDHPVLLSRLLNREPNWKCMGCGHHKQWPYLCAAYPSDLCFS